MSRGASWRVVRAPLPLSAPGMWYSASSSSAPLHASDCCLIWGVCYYVDSGHVMPKDHSKERDLVLQHEERIANTQVCFRLLLHHRRHQHRLFSLLLWWVQKWSSETLLLPSLPLHPSELRRGKYDHYIASLCAFVVSCTVSPLWCPSQRRAAASDHDAAQLMVGREVAREYYCASWMNGISITYLCVVLRHNTDLCVYCIVPECCRQAGLSSAILCWREPSRSLRKRHRRRLSVQAVSCQ